MERLHAEACETMISRQETVEEEDEEVLAYEKEVLVTIAKIIEALFG